MQSQPQSSSPLPEQPSTWVSSSGVEVPGQLQSSSAREVVAVEELLQEHVLRASEELQEKQDIVSTFSPANRVACTGSSSLAKEPENHPPPSGLDQGRGWSSVTLYAMGQRGVNLSDNLPGKRSVFFHSKRQISRPKALIMGLFPLGGAKRWWCMWMSWW